MSPETVVESVAVSVPEAETTEAAPMSVSNPEGSSELLPAETPAAYLAIKPLKEPGADEQRMLFTESALQLAFPDDSSPAEDSELPAVTATMIFSPNEGGKFLNRCAELAFLQLTDTFVSSDDLEDQFHRLVEVNEFAVSPLSAFDAKPGDVIFWRDGEAHIVNAAVVADVTEQSCTVVFSQESNVLSGQIGKDSADEALLSGTVVHVKYAPAECVLLSFFREELQYSTAASAGVVSCLWTEPVIPASGEETESDANEENPEPEIFRDFLNVSQWPEALQKSLSEYCETEKRNPQTLSGQLPFLKSQLKDAPSAEADSLLLSLKDTPENAALACREFRRLFPLIPASDSQTSEGLASSLYEAYLPPDETPDSVS